MMICSAHEEHFTAIARLHKESIATGFLSHLGVAFLTELYRALSRQPGTTVLVAIDENSCIGFVAGTVDTNGLFKRVILTQWLRFIIPLTRSLLSLSNLKKVMETVLYGVRNGNKNMQESTVAELLAIAVDAQKQGNGAGKKLVAGLESYFVKYGVRSYKLVTLSGDTTANDFYRACHFTCSRTFYHHENKMNEYVKTIVANEPQVKS